MMKNRLFRSLAAASLAVMLVLAGCSQGGEPSSSVAENSSSSEPGERSHHLYRHL